MNSSKALINIFSLFSKYRSKPIIDSNVKNMQLQAFFQDLDAFVAQLKGLNFHPVKTLVSEICFSIPAPSAWQQIALHHEIMVNHDRIVLAAADPAELAKVLAQIRILFTEANAIESANIILPENPVLNTIAVGSSQDADDGHSHPMTWEAFKQALITLLDTVKVFSLVINDEGTGLIPKLGFVATVAIPATEPASYFAAKLGLPVEDGAILFEFCEDKDFPHHRDRVSRLTHLLNDYFEHVPEFKA